MIVTISAVLFAAFLIFIAVKRAKQAVEREVQRERAKALRREREETTQ